MPQRAFVGWWHLCLLVLLEAELLVLLVLHRDRHALRERYFLQFQVLATSTILRQRINWKLQLF